MATKSDLRKHRKNKPLRQSHLHSGCLGSEGRTRSQRKNQWIDFYEDVEAQSYEVWDEDVEAQSWEEWDQEWQMRSYIQAQWDEIHQAINQNNADHLNSLLPPINVYHTKAKYWSSYFYEWKYIGGEDILLRAVHLQHSDCVEVILDKIHSRDLSPDIVDYADWRDRRSSLTLACEQGNLDLVQKLIERGRANTSNSQAFFVAFEQGNEAIMNYLVGRCDVRHRDHHDRTVLDCAISGGHMETAKILIYHGDIERNSDGFSPMMLVAHHDISPLVDLLFERLPLQEAVDELVLLASHYTINGDVPNRQKAFDFFVQGLNEEESTETDVLHEAYEHRRECKTFDQLVAIRDDENALRMHALLVSERILLRLSDVDPLLKLIYRQCNVYRNNRLFHRSLQLRLHAHQLTKHTQINHYLQLGLRDHHFDELLIDLDRAWDETRIVPIDLIEGISTWLFDEKQYDCLSHISDLLATITYMIQSEKTTNHEQRLLFAIARRAMRCNTMGHSLLVYYILSYAKYTSIHQPLLYSVSTLSVIQLMIQCGANVNGIGNYRPTVRPLHVIASCFNINIAKPIIELLLAQGAHADCIDSSGNLPQDLARAPAVKELLRPTRKLSLKCRCAQIIVSTRINYRNCLSSNLLAFVRLHTNKETN